MEGPCKGIFGLEEDAAMVQPGPGAVEDKDLATFLCSLQHMGLVGNKKSPDSKYHREGGRERKGRGGGGRGREKSV